MPSAGLAPRPGGVAGRRVALPDPRRLRRHRHAQRGTAVPRRRLATHVDGRQGVGQVRAIGQDRMLEPRVLDAVREQSAEVDPADLRRALALFDGVWGVLHAEEQVSSITSGFPEAARPPPNA